MHSGQRSVASNASFGLRFAGFHNIMATVGHLAAAHGLNTSGNTLVWSGGSAGGVGVFTTVDHVADVLPVVRVVGAPVAGLPPDVEWAVDAHVKGAAPPSEDVHTAAFPRINALWDAFLPTRCVAARGHSARDACGVPHVGYAYVATPLFVMQSLTDIVILCGFEGVPAKVSALLHPSVARYIEDYAHNATALLTTTVEKSARDGLFAPSCLMHTGFTLDGPLIGGVHAVEALSKWVHGANASGGVHVRTRGRSSTANDTQYHRIDSCAHGRYFPPCGAHCPPLPSL